MTQKNAHAHKPSVVAATIVTGGALVMSAGATAAPAVQSVEDQPAEAHPVQAQTAHATSVSQTVQHASTVAGQFAWMQGEVCDTAALARDLYGASRVLCGSVAIDLDAAAASDAVAPIDSITVSGDVANPGTVDVAQMKQAAPIRQIMGCSCAGNPADGRASGNATVAGFQLAALIDGAQPAEGANAITFVCVDGYRVTMPLAYVLQRYSIIVDTINEQDAAQAVGCANQLWLGSTAARAFARDVVEVSITREAETPGVPQSISANLPNVSLTAGA